MISTIIHSALTTISVASMFPEITWIVPMVVELTVPIMMVIHRTTMPSIMAMIMTSSASTTAAVATATFIHFTSVVLVMVHMLRWRCLSMNASLILLFLSLLIMDEVIKNGRRVRISVQNLQDLLPFFERYFLWGMVKINYFTSVTETSFKRKSQYSLECP